MENIAEIERRIDRAVTATIPISANMGGIELANYLHMMELAKTMATCRAGIPEWLRGSIGDCLMIWQRAARWGLDPYFVAEKSYLMEGKSGTRVGYESQLLHAVIESLAPLKGRLRHEITGEGDERRCLVWGTFKGEEMPHKFRSEPLGKRIKDIGLSQAGNFRGSPLWLAKPEVQLFYDASRDWSRINCPDVLGGVYSRDEFPDMDDPVLEVTERTQTLAQRLRDARVKQVQKGRGFDIDHVESEVSNAAAGNVTTDGAEQQEVKDADIQGSGNAPVGEGRTTPPDDRQGGGVHDSGVDIAGGGDQADGPRAAEPQAANAKEDQSEVFPPDRKQAAKPKGKR